MGLQCVQLAELYLFLFFKCQIKRFVPNGQASYYFDSFHGEVNNQLVSGQYVNSPPRDMDWSCFQKPFPLGTHSVSTARCFFSLQSNKTHAPAAEGLRSKYIAMAKLKLFPAASVNNLVSAKHLLSFHDFSGFLAKHFIYLFLPFALTLVTYSQI